MRLLAKTITACTGLGLLAFASATFALPAVGAPVSKINQIGAISGWQALDQHHLLIDLDKQDSYLLTLNRACVALPRAQHVGVSASNNVVYAGFDYVTADGERCEIKSIRVLSPEQRSVLTRA